MEKRTLNDNEVIPLENEIQLKIYSKQKGTVDIFYSSKTPIRQVYFRNL